MNRLALLLALLSTGASADPLPRYVERIHDSERAVTCWIASAGMGIGISCIPDSQLRGGSERQLSPHEQEENGPTPAGADARWNEERYSL